ncbi:IS66 family insertion sequence element accessory protein TnpA [Myxococcus qinghaiensis]|uniref:IS66 family insertion sequence element accessory protein TnpA n=1 Tax=Myxococcus qinghaiensis TaxID=2906758 RepID=UPI003899512F
MRQPSPDEWKQLVAEYEASGESQKEFVARHDVSLGAFQCWLYKKSTPALGRRSESAVRRQAAFLPLEVVASPAP